MEIVKVILEYIITFFEPLANVVGMVVLILLMMGSVVYCAIWIVKKIWKLIVVTVTMVFLLIIFYTVAPMI
ncbi:hypothetical protein NDGK_01671 [Clostridiales bacterium CHKCI001]|nr:hypothetical protein NDGK_01671 [Clostridiales bacterium CHKCI001]